MKDTATFALIQAVLDGEASPAEKAELEARAAASEAVRDEIEASRDLLRELELSGEVAAPHGLRESVLARIRTSRTPRTGQAVILSDAAARLRRRQWIVIGWAAAAVVAIVAVYPLLQPSLTDSRPELAGTMAATAGGWSEVGKASTPSGNAAASLRRNGANVELRVRLAREASIEVRWDPDAVELRDATVSGDRIGVFCPAGDCPAVAFRARGGRPAAVTVALQGGEELTLSENDESR